MRKKHLAVLTKTLFLAAAILMPCGYARAQKLKYVTFFPIPFGSHSDIFVKNKAILGAGHNAEIIFKDNINLSSKLDGSDLELKELWLSPLLENNTDNHDIPTAALGGVYAAKIDVDALNNNTYNLGAESFFKLSKSDDKGIINFDHSDFSFTSDSAIDYTVHSGTLSLGKKGSYKKPLLFHNANNGAIGSIDTSDCKRFCWVQLKLPKEKYFKRYLVCHNQDTCPKTGYEPVNRTQPLYYNFYVMAYGGKGFYLEGEFEGVKLPFAKSGDMDTSTENGVTPEYNLNIPSEVTYYYSNKSNLKLPELTVKAPQKIWASIPPYSLLVPLGVGFELSSDITLVMPDPPVSDDPDNSAVRLDERPPDCPAGASGETICLKAQAKNYRCIRRTLYNPSIDTKVDLMRAASLLSKTATDGAGEVTMHHRKRWPFQWTINIFGIEIFDVDYCSEVAGNDIAYTLCVGSAATYTANAFEDKAHFCCPTVSGTQGKCALDVRVPPIPSSYVINPNNWLCKSTYENGCKCDYLVKDNGGWLLNKYENRYFFFRLKYYTPQWENIATMIECQNTEYKEDGLY